MPSEKFLELKRKKELLKTIPESPKERANLEIKSENKNKLASEKVKSMLKISDQMRIDYGDSFDRVLEQVWDEWERVGLVQPVVIEKIIPKQTNEELQAMREWRERQRELKKFEDDKKKQNELKIQHALKRKFARCYNCNKIVGVTNTSYALEKNRRGENKIIVNFNCVECGKEGKAFGGKLIV